MKNKEGLYAVYSKKHGALINTKVMTSSSAYKSNKDSSTVVNRLLTEDEELMYDYPESDIPKNDRLR